MFLLRSGVVDTFKILQRTSQIQNIGAGINRKCAAHPRFLCCSAKLQFPESKKIKLTEVNKTENHELCLTFDDLSSGVAPFVWLRDNCQCPSCFDPNAFARKILLNDFDFDPKPSQIRLNESSLSITWSDSHVSTYNSEWLHKRAFTPPGKEEHENFHRLTQEPWGKGLHPKEFNYEELMKNDMTLLEWLKTMEVEGVTLVRNALESGDGAKLSDHIGFVRNTHYGRISPVYNRNKVNNIAFLNVELGLHVDLPFYNYQPGIILLHIIKQHESKGGDSVISDGLFSAEYMRKHHPKAFELLTSRNVYFVDRGNADIATEKSFYKIGKSPTIKLDKQNQVEEIRFNNQVRDSYLDVDPSEVSNFYHALKLFNDSLYENSFKYKLKKGEILVLDNLRCLHGREKFADSSERYLETSYLDWDEARCRRRQITYNLAK